MKAGTLLPRFSYLAFIGQVSTLYIYPAQPLATRPQEAASCAGQVF